MRKTPTLWTPPDDFTDPDGEPIDAKAKTVTFIPGRRLP